MQFLTVQSEIIQQDVILMRMMEIMDERNVPVILMPMIKRVNGEAQASVENPKIWLSDRMNVEEMRFVFGHEIGHIFLHSRTNIKHLYSDNETRNRIEIEADIFSLELIKEIERQAALNERNHISSAATDCGN